MPEPIWRPTTRARPLKKVRAGVVPDELLLRAPEVSMRKGVRLEPVYDALGEASPVSSSVSFPGCGGEDKGIGFSSIGHGETGFRRG